MDDWAPEHACPVCGYPVGQHACSRCHGQLVDPTTEDVIRPGRGFFLFDFMAGFATLVRGSILLLVDRAYTGKLTVAILVNILVFILLLAAFVYGLHAAFSEAVAADWGWFQWMQGPIQFAAPVLALLLSFLTLWLLAPTLLVTMTAPFVDGLADTTEKLCGPSMERVPIGLFTEVSESVFLSAQVLALQLALWVPVLLLSFCGVGAVFAFFVSALFTGLVWLEIPCVRRRQGLRRRLKLLRANWARILGFGVAVQIGMLVPLYNALLLTPGAAVGAVLLYLHFDKTSLGPAPPDGVVDSAAKPG